MLSRTLSWAAGNDRARKTVEALGPTRRVVSRFVAGDDEEAAIATVGSLAGSGVSATVDLLGEGIATPAEATRTRDTYVALLRRVADAGLAATTEVSVKLSALGQDLGRTAEGRSPEGERLAFENARAICAAADVVGSCVTLDMEDSSTIDATLRIGDRLRREFPSLGNVLQANVRRTETDLRRLIDTAPGEGTSVRVRLVKGAYRESPANGYQRKEEVDESYRRLIGMAMDSPLRPMVATHDPSMIELARVAADRHGRDASSWEVQMLHGIRGDLVRELADPISVRVYVPYGPDWYPYFMRRLAERPANVAFFLRALTRS